MMRTTAIAAGLAILAAATWLIVTDANLDPRGAHAALLYSMAAGVAAGAVVMARTSWRRHPPTIRRSIPSHC